ncbi:MAG TPA: hypothetical protein VD761_10665 [Solirubrobacterales bacterium]|nr:hypothetical protein [Solirubrobacterales bacterium]
MAELGGDGVARALNPIFKSAVGGLIALQRPSSAAATRPPQAAVESSCSMGGDETDRKEVPKCVQL